jgi:riboflavin transporter FmnP
MILTTPELGLVVVAVSTTLFLLGKARTLTSVGLFVGILMIGINGHVIAWSARALVGVENLIGVTAAKWLGIGAGAVAAALFAVVLTVIIHDWLPRNAAKRRTFYLAGVAGILIAASATPFAAVNQLPATVQQGIHTATTNQGG